MLGKIQTGAAILRRNKAHSQKRSLIKKPRAETIWPEMQRLIEDGKTIAATARIAAARGLGTSKMANEALSIGTERKTVCGSVRRLIWWAASVHMTGEDFHDQ
jgi:hypothetical protein